MRAEIHFHILPGVDDGPATMEESLELARLALSDGTLTIVATPHVCDVDVGELEERLAELREALATANLSTDVACGGEVAASDVGGLSDEELSLVAQGPAGSCWILLEAPHAGSADEFSVAANELRARGFGVVVAHPERSAPLEHGRGAAVAAEVEAGSWLQINGQSLTGGYGDAVKSAALDMLAGDRPVVLSSDAHSRTRPPCLSEAVHAARNAHVNQSRIRAAVEHGPRRLLDLGLLSPGQGPARARAA